LNAENVYAASSRSEIEIELAAKIKGTTQVTKVASLEAKKEGSSRMVYGIALTMTLCKY
jgi:hypothetical protein